MHLVQLSHPDLGRRVAVVEEPKLRLLARCKSVYELAGRAITQGRKIAQVIEATDETIDYDPVYAGQSAWKLLPAFDHPEPSRFYITGTGLTHKASAANRQSMHQAAGPVSDSMKMYNMGLEGGRPVAGCVGTSPEWFYKGDGQIVRACGEPLDVPCFSEDGGEEAEIAGVYLIGGDARIFRIGMTQGNEFADHVVEAKNYLYLAGSKLRACSIGPELIIDADFSEVPGQTCIVRNGKIIWQSPLASGEKNMCHSLANMEHHHFKYPEHRRPGDAHLHFFGADNFSFKDRLKLQDGDVMEFEFKGFGRPLHNPLKVEKSGQRLVNVIAL